jgi:hypothetical protein
MSQYYGNTRRCIPTINLFYPFKRYLGVVPSKVLRTRITDAACSNTGSVFKFKCFHF